MQMKPMDRRWVDLDAIYIGARLRSPDMAKVAELAKSISEIGLLNPPAVRFVESMIINGVEELNVPILIVGHHRILALKSLGKESVECDVYNVDPLRAELMEIAENLHRADLTALQRDEQIARWIELTTAKNEVDKPVQSAPVSTGGRGNKGGINEASRQLGIERTDAHRATKVASLSPDAKAVAVETGLADNRSALLAAAKQRDPEKQVASLHQWRQRTHAEVMAAASALPAIASAQAGEAKLDKRLASMKAKVEDKEEQRKAQEHRANIAVKQVDSATNRAMYAEAEVERLRAEVERLTEENGLLRSENARLADWNGLSDESQYKRLLSFIDEDVRGAFLAHIKSGAIAA